MKPEGTAEWPHAFKFPACLLLLSHDHVLFDFDSSQCDSTCPKSPLHLFVNKMVSLPMRTLDNKSNGNANLASFHFFFSTK